MKCGVCGKEFKAITGKHLKSHNISSDEYKNTYGEMFPDELKKRIRDRVSGKNNPNYGKKHTEAAKQRISESNKGRVAHNKGIALSAEQKKILSEKALARNRVWRENGTHPNVGSKRSPEVRDKIKKARANQAITTESVMKAIQTKKDRGYDLAFFRGKTHSDESKKLISKKSIEHHKIRTAQSQKEAVLRMGEYGYSVIKIEDTYMDVKCNQCDTIFNRTYQYASKSKITYELCPKCYPPLIGTSKAEREIADWLEQYTNVSRNDRSIIPPLELDIYLPEYKVAIEYNGLYWHNELRKDKNYHLDKTNKCLENGVRLIHVFEDEYENTPTIVKDRLKNMLGINKRIYARKCEVKTIKPTEANAFIKRYHIQGSGRANVHLGLWNDSELVAVMTFLNGDISKGITDWELNRFCNKYGVTVVGGASKLFKYFTRHHNTETVISYADRRWSAVSPFYEKLGFDHTKDTVPNYWYILPNEMNRIHRYALRKPSGCVDTERELRLSEGYLRIYDCGSSKYIWRK